MSEAASRYVSAQTEVAFESDEFHPRLLITPHTYVTTNLALVKLRLYPNVPAKIRATAGTVRTAENLVNTIGYEILKFDGNDRAQLKYPGSTGHVFTNINAFFDADGNDIKTRIDFAYDPLNDEVVASQAFYGGVQVAYSAPYRVLEYTAEIEEIGDPIDPGYSVRYGMILAAYLKTVITYSIQAPKTTSNSDYVEIYRVYSKVIADPEGRWEVPPGWPKYNAYPYGNQGRPDPENSHDEERPVEVGFVDKLGRLDFQTYYAVTEKPYGGT